jgi:hypothetical protein
VTGMEFTYPMKEIQDFEIQVVGLCMIEPSWVGVSISKSDMVSEFRF